MSTAPDDLLRAALLQLAEHGERLDELAAAIAVLHDQIQQQDQGSDEDEDAPGKPYKPVPAPRWWLLEGDERHAAIRRLRAWVDQVFRPGYGHLAASLPACWPRHPLALYVLDFLSELHASLYIQPRRAPGHLTGQAEWTMRFLPPAMDLIVRDARNCGHDRAAARVNGPRP
jgi:hypothetical protein